MVVWVEDQPSRTTAPSEAKASPRARPRLCKAAKAARGEKATGESLRLAEAGSEAPGKARLHGIRVQVWLQELVGEP